METSDFSSTIVKSECLLCCRTEDPKFTFYNINNKQLPKSNKNIRSVLTHLVKCLKKDYNFNLYSYVCSLCHNKLVKYDETMVRLMKYQKELCQMLEEAMESSKQKDEVPNNSVDNDFVSDHEIKTSLVNEDLSSQCSVKSLNDNDNESFNENENENESNCNEDSDSDIPNFICTLCDEGFKSKHGLKVHMKTHEEIFRCKICGAVRKDEDYLQLHMNIHEGKTENECRYCPKVFTKRSLAVRHMQIHWDKQKYQCEKCGLRFSQTRLLYNHKWIHEEPLVCEVCRQIFKTRKTYRNHIIIHQKDRPMYPCEICGKVFTQKYTVKAHMRTHMTGYEQSSTSKKSVSQGDQKQCIICAIFCTNQEALEAHMATEHDVIPHTEVFSY